MQGGEIQWEKERLCINVWVGVGFGCNRRKNVGVKVYGYQWVDGGIGGSA